MKRILLCTHNPLLVKGLYGILRDEGYDVATADSPARAVQMVFQGSYAAVIIDSRAFGLSAEDAVQIIKSVSPGIEIILVGYPEYEADSSSIRIPEDLEELRKLVHGIHGMSSFS